MNKNNKFVIIGGDNRQIYMADYLENKGYEVSVYALPEEDRQNCRNIKKELESTRFVILPLPVTKDGRNIHSLTDKKVSVDEIVSILNADHIVFGGMLSNNMLTKINKKADKVYDYFKLEEVTVRNTVPTVQGILKVIFDNINYTVNSSKCAVLGYGRVASYAADVLASLGADVTVCVRKRSDIAKAEIRNLKGCFLNEFAKFANQFDIIINTVPYVLLDKENLINVKKDCIIIDVASAPYGVDFAAADSLGLNAILCPSLPGKVAPLTAGRIIADGILNIIEEESYG